MTGRKNPEDYARGSHAVYTRTKYQEDPWKYKSNGKNRSKEQILDSNLWSNYRIRLSDYYKLLEDQNFACYICGGTSSDGDRKLAVDHDHSCCPGKKSCGKCVRGLLCGNCNRLLGNAKDSRTILLNAIKYLDEKSLNC